MSDLTEELSDDTVEIGHRVLAREKRAPNVSVEMEDGQAILVIGENDEPPEFLKVMEAMAALGMESSFADRYLNEGFSGGERKRNEVLQMAVLQPLLAVMDETDSGLDIDALRTVSEGVNALRSPDRAVILVTHYQRLLDYIQPDVVHVLSGGKIVRSGDRHLAKELEQRGYGWLADGEAA